MRSSCSLSHPLSSKTHPQQKKNKVQTQHENDSKPGRRTEQHATEPTTHVVLDLIRIHAPVVHLSPVLDRMKNPIVLKLIENNFGLNLCFMLKVNRALPRF